LLLWEVDVFMSLVRAEMSSCSTGTGNFSGSGSLDVDSILSDMPSSLIFSFSILLNSSFSEVFTREAEASTHFESAAGICALVVLGARLLGRPLFDTLLCDEALATGFMDELEANTAAFLSSVLLDAARTVFFLDTLLGPGPLLEILVVDANPLGLITSLRVVFPCPVTELLCATLLSADIDSRAELAKLTGLTLAETSGRIGVARLRNLSSPALALELLDLTLEQVLIPSFLTLLCLGTASPSELDLLIFGAPKPIVGNTTVLASPVLTE
jgi:hypothetical protein